MTGRDDFPRAGYPHGDIPELPADLAAVQADDALLDILGSGGRPGDAGDDLTRLLAAWRREVHAEPVGELVDTDTALAVIRAAVRQPARRRSPVFGSIAAAAAVLVIAFAGVGLVAKEAQPGDNLWGVTQVLYRDYARSVETAATVRTELNDARTALQQNKPEKARASLQRVQQQLPVIGETEGRTDLTSRHRELEQILKGSPEDGSATMPASPTAPSSSAPRNRSETTSPPKTSEPPSTEPTTTPNSTTEQQNSTSPTPPSQVPPGLKRDHSGVGSPGSSPPADPPRADAPRADPPPGGPPRAGPPRAGPPRAGPPRAGPPRADPPPGGPPAAVPPAGGGPGDNSFPGADPQGGRNFPGADHTDPGMPAVCDHAGPRSPRC